MDVLPGLWSLSPLGALVGVLVWLFLWMGSGRGMTRRQHEQILAAHTEAQKTRGDEWKATALEYKEANGLLLGRSVVLPSEGSAQAVVDLLRGT